MVMLKSKFCLLFIAYFKRVISKNPENSTYSIMPKYLLFQLFYKNTISNAQFLL